MTRLIVSNDFKIDPAKSNLEARATESTDVLLDQSQFSRNLGLRLAVTRERLTQSGDTSLVTNTASVDDFDGLGPFNRNNYMRMLAARRG